MYDTNAYWFSFSTTHARHNTEFCRSVVLINVTQIHQGYYYVVEERLPYRTVYWIAQSTSSIPYNTPFWIVHCGLWEMHCGICELGQYHTCRRTAPMSSAGSVLLRYWKKQHIMKSKQTTKILSRNFWHISQIIHTAHALLYVETGFIYPYHPGMLYRHYSNHETA